MLEIHEYINQKLPIESLDTFGVAFVGTLKSSVVYLNKKLTPHDMRVYVDSMIDNFNKIS